MMWRMTQMRRWGDGQTERSSGRIGGWWRREGGGNVGKIDCSKKQREES